MMLGLQMISDMRRRRQSCSTFTERGSKCETRLACALRSYISRLSGWQAHDSALICSHRSYHAARAVRVCLLVLHLLLSTCILDLRACFPPCVAASNSSSHGTCSFLRSAGAAGSLSERVCRTRSSRPRIHSTACAGDARRQRCNVYKDRL